MESGLITLVRSLADTADLAGYLDFAKPRPMSRDSISTE